MAILPTDIRIRFTNYDIITCFLNLASCSEHLITIKHRILTTFNTKKIISDSLYAFKLKIEETISIEQLRIQMKGFKKLYMYMGIFCMCLY